MTAGKTNKEYYTAQIPKKVMNVGVTSKRFKKFII